jgi:antitoxin VapB
MKTTTAPKKASTSTATTSVFVSGNSQAVRLPKEFRVASRTLEIFRRGEEIVLRERSPTIAEVLADLPALSAQQARDFDAFTKLAKSALPAAEERDFSWLHESASPAKPKRAKQRRARG